MSGGYRLLEGRRPGGIRLDAPTCAASLPYSRPEDSTIVVSGIPGAVHFENRHLTLVHAAKLAGLSVEEFVILLGEAGIPVADYPAEELDEEVGTAS